MNGKQVALRLIRMEVDTTEWDAICRICLQEGQLFSIFDYEDESTDVTIAKKISMCSAIEVTIRLAS